MVDLLVAIGYCAAVVADTAIGMWNVIEYEFNRWFSA